MRAVLIDKILGYCGECENTIHESDLFQTTPNTVCFAGWFVCQNCGLVQKKENLKSTITKGGPRWTPMACGVRSATHNGAETTHNINKQTAKTAAPDHTPGAASNQGEG
jgi:hypothetical protein